VLNQASKIIFKLTRCPNNKIIATINSAKPTIINKYLYEIPIIGSGISMTLAPPVALIIFAMAVIRSKTPEEWIKINSGLDFIQAI